jgi:hypothetical protein
MRVKLIVTWSYRHGPKGPTDTSIAFKPGSASAIYFNKLMKAAAELSKFSESMDVETAEAMGQDVWSLSLVTVANQNNPHPSNIAFTGAGNGKNSLQCLVPLSTSCILLYTLHVPFHAF